MKRNKIKIIFKLSNKNNYYFNNTKNIKFKWKENLCNIQLSYHVNNYFWNLYSTVHYRTVQFNYYIHNLTLRDIINQSRKFLTIIHTTNYLFLCSHSIRYSLKKILFHLILALSFTFLLSHKITFFDK